VVTPMPIGWIQRAFTGHVHIVVITTLSETVTAREKCRRLPPVGLFRPTY